MRSKINELKAVTSKKCVSIILNTHKTSTDNLVDAIQLKNLIKETEQRLSKELEKKSVDQLSNLRAFDPRKARKIRNGDRSNLH